MSTDKANKLKMSILITACTILLGVVGSLFSITISNFTENGVREQRHHEELLNKFHEVSTILVEHKGKINNNNESITRYEGLLYDVEETARINAIEIEKIKYKKYNKLTTIE